MNKVFFNSKSHFVHYSVQIGQEQLKFKMYSATDHPGILTKWSDIVLVKNFNWICHTKIAHIYDFQRHRCYPATLLTLICGSTTALIYVHSVTIVLSLFDLLCSLSTDTYRIIITTNYIPDIVIVSPTFSRLIQISDTGNGSIHPQKILFPKIARSDGDKALSPSQPNDSFLHFLARSSEHKSIECFHYERCDENVGLTFNVF